MKIILSRKGFDSSSGGCPNPILPDGHLLPLPIPDESSPVCYGDLQSLPLDKSTGGQPHTINIGQLVADLTGGRLSSESGAHVDPDIDPGSCSRQPQWRPVFGQSGAAQGHLARQGVSDGDLFLFFGLFQPVECNATGSSGYRWRFCPRAPKQHIFWGWFQIDQVIDLDALNPTDLQWARYHPHFHGPHTGANYLYLARDKLVLGRGCRHSEGAGLFQTSHPSRVLTAPEANSPSQWLLPRWFYPGDGQPPLSYHSKAWRWRRGEQGTYLQSVARGQEFVLDADQYPEAKRWALSLIKS